MRNVLSPVCCVLALTAFGCGANASGVDPYEQAASEVESAVSALAEEDADDTALDGAADDGDAATPRDDHGDSDEAMEEANGGHEGKGRGKRGKHHHGRGHRHGRGHDLLLWYADLDALEICRDQRESCKASADPSTCKDEVRACVKPVIDAAFAAMCEERVALCSAADAPKRSCKRVAKHC